MKPEPTFVRVLQTDSLTDIALIKSVLEGERVRYFLKGENMKTIRPVDPVLLMVADDDVERVRKLLAPLELSYMQFQK